jgi:hypothetical protein
MWFRRLPCSCSFSLSELAWAAAWTSVEIECAGLLMLFVSLAKTAVSALLPVNCGGGSVARSKGHGSHVSEVTHWEKGPVGGCPGVAGPGKEANCGWM